MDIIQYFLNYVTTLYQNYCWLLMFVCKYIPLRQWAFDDSHSPKYQKFKVDQLPKIVYHHQDWDWKDRSGAAPNVISRKTVPAPSVRLPSPTCTEITVKPDSSCARSAADGFPRMRTVFPKSFP